MFDEPVVKCRERDRNQKNTVKTGWSRRGNVMLEVVDESIMTSWARQIRKFGRYEPKRLRWWAKLFPDPVQTLTRIDSDVAVNSYSIKTRQEKHLNLDLQFMDGLVEAMRGKKLLITFNQTLRFINEQPFFNLPNPYADPSNSFSICITTRADACANQCDNYTAVDEEVFSKCMSTCVVFSTHHNITVVATSCCRHIPTTCAYSSTCSIIRFIYPSPFFMCKPSRKASVLLLSLLSPLLCFASFLFNAYWTSNGLYLIIVSNNFEFSLSSAVLFLWLGPCSIAKLMPSKLIRQSLFDPTTVVKIVRDKTTEIVAVL